MIKIVPTILAKDFTKFESDVRAVEGFAPKIQMDIVDGKFAETETVLPEALLEIETPVEVEAHLMVEEPEEWVERCAAAGITAVCGQVEKMSDKLGFVAKAEEAGMRTGLGFEIETPLTGLDEWINMVDSVLLLAVKAGAQGQSFDERVLERIKMVRALSDHVTIVIDGGLDEEKIRKCLAVGGERMEFAVGSSILTAENPEIEFKKLEALG